MRSFRSISTLFLTHIVTDQEKQINIESAAELLQDVNVLPFVDLAKLPTEVVNAVRNYLATEILSVRHQLHFLAQHHKSLYSSYEEAVRVGLERTKLDDGEQGTSTDPLALAEASASTSG